MKKVILKSTALALALLGYLNADEVANTSMEAAKNVAKNPFGLVYENAISKNEQ